jgi:predicted RNase H-like HicB family nuclease
VPGAHSQGDTLDEPEMNLREVLELLTEPEAEPFGVRLTPPLEW